MNLFRFYDELRAELRANIRIYGRNREKLLSLERTTERRIHYFGPYVYHEGMIERNR